MVGKENRIWETETIEIVTGITEVVTFFIEKVTGLLSVIQTERFMIRLYG